MKQAALVSADECPSRRLHTTCPTRYLAWHEWADKKSRRHYQVACPGCGLFKIWKRKPAGQLTSGE